MKKSISRRSFLKAVGALSAAGALAACGGSSTSTAASTASSAAPAASAEASGSAAASIKLWTYPIGGWGKDETVQEIIASFNAKYPDIKVTVEYLDYTNGDDQVNTAITAGSDLLIVNIVETSSPDAAQNAVEAAKTAGIPIIFFNREVSDDVVKSYDKCAFVGTDAPEAGHMQGKLVGEYLLANYDAVDLNGDGSISYVMFKGQEGNAEAEARTQYGVEDANELLTAAGKPELVYYNASATDKYLVDQGGKWSAQAANDYMATILPEYSEANGNMVELIICNNDGMAEGAISALQGAGYNMGDGGKTIPVFGVDATESAKQLINEGKMTGTIKQDADGMASTILNLVSSVKGGGNLMDNTSSFNVDAGVAKIRVPYATYTGE